MNYHPKNMYHWDFWMIGKDGEVHSFNLYRMRPGAIHDPYGLDWLGHAVSDDLITWRQEPNVIPPGPAGSLDDMKHWTGHIIEKDDIYYLYYTGRSSREGGKVQRTMLATSPDLYNWSKCEGNPVMRADHRWYTAEQVADRDYTIGWRDPRVVLDETSGWYYAFLAADLRDVPYAERGCVARARSRDLLHWDILPPAFAPRKYATIEVPDVFFLDGRWYLTLLTGTAYSNARGTFSDPHINMGTIYAVSDSLDGQFRELDDNVLIGAKWWEGTSCRTIEFKGKRYLFYFQCEREGRSDSGSFNWGTLTTPKELVTTAEGYLRAVYSPLIEKKVRTTIFEGMPEALEHQEHQFPPGRWTFGDGRALGSCGAGWTGVCTKEMGQSFIFTGSVNMRHGRAAGLMFHAQSFWDSYAVLLDYEKQMFFLTRIREFDVLQARSVAIRYSQTYQLRVVVKGEFYEIYLDDVLMINCVRYALPEGTFGLMVEMGEAEFSDLLALDLDIN